MPEAELAIWLETNFWVVKLGVFIGVFLGASLATYWVIGRLGGRNNDNIR